MESRIKYIRKKTGLTQTAFGERIGVKGNTITNYENGLRKPTDAVVLSICREFRVNEEWLRYGNEPIYLPQEDEDAAFVSELLFDSDNELYSIIKAIMKTYNELGEKEKKVLESFARDLRDNLK